jgi:predicted DNA-binding transcriptional regulator YafY
VSSTTTRRVLACLELLQDRPGLSGPELAARLEVDVRTVRRYVATLQDLGIPIAGARGLGGGYRLRPGYRLPPLMLGDGEAVAVVLGLQAARRLGVAAPGPAVEGALAKLLRVLPAALRGQVEALEQAVAFTGVAPAAPPPPPAAILSLADAIRRRRRIVCTYETHDGARGRRELSAYGIVVHAGRWYLAAHDHERAALRTFRADRLEEVVLGGSAAPAPDGFDPVTHVSGSLAEVPWTWPVAVTLELPLDAARRRLPPTLARLEALDASRTRVRMRVESLDYMAGLLAGLECDFEIERPVELRASVAALARRLGEAAARGSTPRAEASRVRRPRSARHGSE